MSIEEAFLKALTPIAKDSLEEGDKLCLICHEEFESQAFGFECAIKLHCTHIFGSRCIRTWAKSSNSCPMCRSPVVPFSLLASKREEEDHDTLLEIGGHWMQPAADAYERHLAEVLRQYLERLMNRAVLETTPENFQVASGLQWCTRPWNHQGLETNRITRYRERLLYQQLQTSGTPLPALQAFGPGHVGNDHEDALFHALDTMEVFDIPWQGFTALWDRRETFERMREGGFVWDPQYQIPGRVQRGAWAGLVMSGGEWGYVHVS